MRSPWSGTGRCDRRPIRITACNAVHDVGEYERHGQSSGAQNDGHVGYPVGCRDRRQIGRDDQPTGTHQQVQNVEHPEYAAGEHFARRVAAARLLHLDVRDRCRRFARIAGFRNELRNDEDDAALDQAEPERMPPRSRIASMTIRIGIMVSAAPAPKPPATRPTAKPRWSLNHLTAVPTAAQ